MSESFHHPMVPPLFEREEEAIPGPFYVAKDQCIICEFPPSISPRCIRMNDALCNSEKYCHVFKQPETEDQWSVIQKVAQSKAQFDELNMRITAGEKALDNQNLKDGKNGIEMVESFITKATTTCNLIKCFTGGNMSIDQLSKDMDDLMKAYSIHDEGLKTFLKKTKTL